MANALRLGSPGAALTSKRHGGTVTWPFVEVNTHPAPVQEIAVHICPQCRKDIALPFILSGGMKLHLRDRLRYRLLPSPVRNVFLAEYSMIYSEHDSPSRPNERLLDIAAAAIAAARKADVLDIAPRLGSRFGFPNEAINLWPGVNYRLLAGLMQTLAPKQVVEIGTSEGVSALTMLKYLRPDASLTTFDVIPWRNISQPRGTCLRESDFADGRLRQEVADLGDNATFGHYSALLSGADFLFVDGPKDGVFEPRFVAALQTIPMNCIALFDDTRWWNMLKVWRELPWPKLDLTSFGSWCGVGLVEIRHKR